MIRVASTRHPAQNLEPLSIILFMTRAILLRNIRRTEEKNMICNMLISRRRVGLILPPENPITEVHSLRLAGMHDDPMIFLHP